MMYGSLTKETSRSHRPDMSNHSITPEELEGLEAVLRVTERVADKVSVQTSNSRVHCTNNIFICTLCICFIPKA